MPSGQKPGVISLDDNLRPLDFLIVIAVVVVVIDLEAVLLDGSIARTTWGRKKEID